MKSSKPPGPRHPAPLVEAAQAKGVGSPVHPRAAHVERMLATVQAKLSDSSSPSRPVAAHVARAVAGLQAKPSDPPGAPRPGRASTPPCAGCRQAGSRLTPLQAKLAPRSGVVQRAADEEMKVVARPKRSMTAGSEMKVICTYRSGLAAARKKTGNVAFAEVESPSDITSYAAGETEIQALGDQCYRIIARSSKEFHSEGDFVNTITTLVQQYYLRVRVSKVFSEREPCKKCRPLLDKLFANLGSERVELGWLVPWPTDEQLEVSGEPKDVYVEYAREMIRKVCG